MHLGLDGKTKRLMDELVFGRQPTLGLVSSSIKATAGNVVSCLTQFYALWFIMENKF